MIRAGNERKNHLHLSIFGYTGQRRPPAPWKMIHWQAFSVNYQLLVKGFDSKRFLF